ncbi:unnamed protein product [Acanthoscelides obtectus]|uniref:Uncharacterized protein n=1 Tax=Acanthoscelides obtectus TaxID=200917 RepID=A0A9P0QJG8_ACAOB|nr:unnamed protein product [Acanthoscelides obtectus]CAK1686106.1 hypothetical protein AOBTE_LOCUS35783 [Acanthoscelides obtectus]
MKADSSMKDDFHLLSWRNFGSKDCLLICTCLSCFKNSSSFFFNLLILGRLLCSSFN